MSILLLLLAMLLALRVLVLGVLLLTLLLLLVGVLVLDLVELLVTALLLLLVWTYGVLGVEKVRELTEEVRPGAVGIAGPGGAVAGMLVLTLTFDPCTTIEGRVCRGGEKTYGVLLCEDVEWASKPLPPLLLL